VASEIHHIRHVLHENRDRAAGLHVCEVGRIELRARVLSERFRMRLDLAQLRSADASEGLAGRTADDDIEGFRHPSEIQVPDELSRRGRGDVARHGVLRLVRMEIGAVGGSRRRVVLDRSRDLESRRVKAERKSAASRKKIKNPRLCAGSKPRNLFLDDAVRHNSFGSRWFRLNRSGCGSNPSLSRNSRTSRAISGDFL